MVDFASILGKTAGTAEAPKPLPSGTYFGSVSGRGVPVTKKTKEGEKGVVRFTFALGEAGEDVDADELENAGGLRKKDGSAKTVVREYWLTPDAMFIFDQFLEGFGYERDGDGGFGKTYDEIIQEIEGRDVTLSLELNEFDRKDGTKGVNNEVKRVFATQA